MPLKHNLDISGTFSISFSLFPSLGALSQFDELVGREDDDDDVEDDEEAVVVGLEDLDERALSSSSPLQLQSPTATIEAAAVHQAHQGREQNWGASESSGAKVKITKRRT